MNKAEPLCDLRFVKAEYRLAGGKHTFSMAEKNGEQFAAELDVLAALIRARIIRARVEGEEAE